MEDGYKIICTNCRAPVASNAEACSHCGQGLYSARDVGPSAPQADMWPQPWRPLSSGTPAGVMIAAPSSTAGIRPAAATSYGGFWRRVVANLIDSLVLLLPAILLERTFGQGASLLSLLMNWFYFALMESSAGQATVGKAALGLAVTDFWGERISFWRATGRYFAKILSALTLGVGFMMVGWTRQKRGLHDFLAGTLVVRR